MSPKLSAALRLLCYLCVDGLAKWVIYCIHFVKLLCLYGIYTLALTDVVLLAGLLSNSDDYRVIFLIQCCSCYSCLDSAPLSS